MKTKDQAIIDAVAQFNHIRAQLKASEKQLKSLRATIERKMGESTVLEAGKFVLTRSECERRTLDRDKIEGLLGEDLSEYERITKYYKLEIK